MFRLIKFIIMLAILLFIFGTVWGTLELFNVVETTNTVSVIVNKIPIFAPQGAMPQFVKGIVEWFMSLGK